MGHNPEAAVYAGTSLKRMTMLAMCLSGALAGFVGVNELMGVHQRIVLDFPAGYGFAGIAVALMGRSHPLGIVLAALLFGALQQGGAELAFDIPTITREMVVVIQGLIILFSGALAHCRGPGCRGCWPSFPPLAREGRCPRSGRRGHDHGGNSRRLDRGPPGLRSGHAPSRAERPSLHDKRLIVERRSLRSALRAPVETTGVAISPALRGEYGR